MKKNSRRIMTVVLLGYLIILIDTSLVFTCSNEIGASFQMTTQAATWISNAYALTFGSLLLFGGRLGDIFNRRLIFSIGLLIFGTASLCVGLAPNGVVLIATRAIQGIGAAIIAPATLAIIMDNFTGAAQTHAIVIYGAMSGIGVSLGLIVGAGITTIASWRVGFPINVPITLLLIALTYLYVPAHTHHSPGRVDYLGSLLSFTGIALITNGINGVGNKLFSFFGGVALLIVFILVEKRATTPVLPLAIFQSAHRVNAYLIRFCYSGAITSFWFFTPRILQTVYQLSPILVGASFLPMTIVNFFSAQQVNRWTANRRQESIMIGGLVIATLGFGGLLLLKGDSSYWLGVALPMILVGYGQGLILSPVTNIAVAGLPSSLGGIASGLINVMLQIGGVVGLAALSVLSGTAINIHNYHLQMLGVTIMSAIALLLALRYLRTWPRQK